MCLGHRDPAFLIARGTAGASGTAAWIAIGIAFCSLASPAWSAVPSEPFDSALYAQLLERHTQSVEDTVGTRVDYRALGESSEWKKLVAQVSGGRPSMLSKQERLAFWINAYNILTIDLILRHYPVESIRDIGSFFFPVWDKPVATIEGQEVSLGFIEHEILRKMGDPRIHAAIVCASTSCPPLARRPFRAGSIDQDLDQAMATWLASPTKGVKIDRERKRVQVSAIFKWFSEDFEEVGGVQDAIAPYLPLEDGIWLKTNKADTRVVYFDYDWSLNDLR